MDCSWLIAEACKTGLINVLRLLQDIGHILKQVSTLSQVDENDIKKRIQGGLR